MTVYSEAIGWTERGALRLLDQTRLPAEVRYLEIESIDTLAEAISSLQVRGAPLIGIAAAMGLAAAARAAVARGERVDQPWIDRAVSTLGKTRPTAVNLSWALERMRRVAICALDQGRSDQEVAEALRAEAQQIWDEDAAMCEAIGRVGEPLVPAGATILTHCNTGFLATGGIGTALGVIYTVHRAGKGIEVVVCETRPLGQGARLTAFELARAGVPAKVIVDSAAGALMARGEIDLVIVGADRIAANGDTANKIGTYGLAVLARAHGLPFYVAAPRTSFDLTLSSGDDIQVEERGAGEILLQDGVEVYNPAFDVTPAELITAIITDRGIIAEPSTQSISRLLIDKVLES